MINFVVYETSEKIRTEYEMIILNFVGIREEKFKIYNYCDFIKNNSLNNIYIISHNSIKCALKIASSIRNNGDWKSQIIVISNFNNKDLNLLINNNLILDYINNNSNYTDRLKKDLYLAYKLLSSEKSLCFYLNSEINKIPYNSILYIEKNNNQNYCTIHTIDTEYIIKETITSLEKRLDSAIFMKTHRSCIVNLNNIEYYNCSNNIITFMGNKRIDLISRDKKQILKSKLTYDKVKK